MRPLPDDYWLLEDSAAYSSEDEVVFYCYD